MQIHPIVLNPGSRCQMNHTSLHMTVMYVQSRMDTQASDPTLFGFF